MMETIFSKIYEKIDLTLLNHLLPLIMDHNLVDYALTYIVLSVVCNSLHLSSSIMVPQMLNNFLQ